MTKFVSQVDDVITKLLGRTAKPNFTGSSFSIGLTASTVARQNPNRVYLGFFNTSASDIFISPFPQVASTYGILVPPSGGSVILTVSDDFILPSLEWWAVASLAASPLFIIEQLAIPSSNTVVD